MDNKAVIIIDMLNDFMIGDLKCERAQHMIPNLTRARAKERFKSEIKQAIGSFD